MKRDRNTASTNAAVIGVGNMGRHHARVYNKLPNVNLVGVYDVNDSTVRSVAEEYNTRALNLEALLHVTNVVSIAVPTQYHADIARQCIDHGVDVLVEKPFVDDLETGRELVDKAKEADVTVQVGHIERFNPAIRTLSEIMAGLDVIAVNARRLGPPPEDRQLDKSAVLDLMIHDIDVVLAMLDNDIDSLVGHGTKNNQYATANLTFEDGTVATLTASRVTQQRVRKLAITAENCRVNVDYIDQLVEIHRHSLPEYVKDNGDVCYRHESIVERPTVETGEPLKNELEAFVLAATGDADPVISGEDGLQVLEVAREIHDAAADERPEAEVSAR